MRSTIAVVLISLIAAELSAILCERRSWDIFRNTTASGRKFRLLRKQNFKVEEELVTIDTVEKFPPAGFTTASADLSNISPAYRS